MKSLFKTYHCYSTSWCFFQRPSWIFDGDFYYWQVFDCCDWCYCNNFVRFVSWNNLWWWIRHHLRHFHPHHSHWCYVRLRNDHRCQILQKKVKKWRSKLTHPDSWSRISKKKTNTQLKMNRISLYIHDYKTLK